MEESAVVVPGQAIANQASWGKTIVNYDNITANLKVYQSDVEVAGLFVLPSGELLVCSKLVAPLTRLDRCAGRSYAKLHDRQSFLLQSRSRFNRYQRLHTSDGDTAQSLGERVLEYRSKKRGDATIPAFRLQCQVHRVYHAMAAGVLLC